VGNLVKPGDLAVSPWYFRVEDDFIYDQLDNLWVDTITDSGTVSIGDAVGGIVALVPSDGTVADNDEAYLATPNEVFKLAAGKPIYAEALVQFTEAATNAANVAFGLADAPGANLLVDNGGGLRASGSVVAIYKIDGGTVWRCVTRNNGVVTDSVSTKTAGGSSYQTLSIEVVDRDPSNCTVVFKVDKQYLLDSTTGLVIRHTIALASATEMAGFLAVKNGGANLETLNCDYISFAQTR
jgi:hypothetical protein